MNTAANDDQNAGAEDARISAGALRMRCSRQRRRDGMRCLTIELHDAEIDRLIALGYLQASYRDDQNEVLLAIYRFIEGSALG